MTRQHTSKPVWIWSCDRCESTSGDLAHAQDQLPSAEDMRERGWFIAERWGDLCSKCHHAPELPVSVVDADEGDQ